VKRERWERVNAILDLALDAPSAQRAAIIASECGNDHELAAEVARFLANCDDASSLFEGAPQEVVNAAFAATSVDSDELKPGDIVGAYRVVEKIGAGGMGAVYHAERADGEFEKRVALKVIRRGEVGGDVLTRFHDERRILARLQHPNIAALLDGGATAVGPYFVMEYAAGEPIDRYVNRAGASLEERIRLFLTVCEAVHYAHQNLIVHRDLKPSNVLVANGEPKLLDFGIAKVLDPETGAGVVATDVTELRLTPQYAAPEQVLGKPVTTATDVYALGMILYELVAGALPYDVRALSMMDVARVVCRTDPPAPSVTARVPVTTPREGVTSIGWRIPKDLDAIVLKTLEKDPARRYGSVAGLIEDLRRFLDGRPVRAQPDTFLYRASKFVRRNAPMVGLASAAALALMIGMIAAAWQARVAAAERDRAVQGRAEATATLDYLVSAFAEFDPDRLRGQRTFTHEELTQSLLSNLDALEPQPRVRAPIMNTLAQVIFNLGDRDRGEQLYTDARLLLEPMGPSANLAVSLMGIGVAHQRSLRFEEAVAAFRRALDIRREVLEANDPAIGESMAALAFAMYNIGASIEGPAADSLFAEAESLYVGALATLSEPTLSRARALEGLGDIELSRGNGLQAGGDSANDLFRSAQEHYREAIRTAVFATNDTTPDDARRMWGLAQTQDELGDIEGAIQTSRDALRVMERTYGESHPDVALAQYYLGAYLARAGHHADAATFYERSANLSGGNAPDVGPYTGPALIRAGRARMQASQPAQALIDARSALEIWTRELGQAGLSPARASSVRRSLAETSTLLAEAFDLLQQPDSARHYRARAASFATP
jgi:serine/threonine-protein kinase